MFEYMMETFRAMKRFGVKAGWGISLFLHVLRGKNLIL